MIQFEWDPAKAKMNLRKHGVAFREAATVLRDPLGITICREKVGDVREILTFSWTSSPNTH